MKHNWYCSTLSRHYMYFARVTITWDIFITGPTRPGLTKQNTYNFARQISFAEHRKVVAVSSEFHFMLSRAHFFQLETRKKSGTVKSGKAIKKLEFMPESGNVDTYAPTSRALCRDQSMRHLDG